jgi:hypothetical protein
VKALLLSKDEQIRELTKNLYYYDYLDHAEIEKIMGGEKLHKERVREWSESAEHMIRI